MAWSGGERVGREDLLRRLWSADDRETNELRARHLQAVLSSTPWTLGVTLANVALCVAYLGRRIDSPLFAGWAAFMTVLAGYGLVSWWRRRARPRLAVPPRAVRSATLHAGLLALAWGLLPAIWFPELPAAEQLLLGYLVVGNLAAGAIALAWIPSAAWAYAGLQALASLVALQRSEHALAQPIQALLVLYVVVLCVAATSVARVFSQRHLSEKEAARQGEVVGLLLRDFEETTADVLWEIDPRGRFVQISDRLAALLERPTDKLAQLGLLQALQSVQAEGSNSVDRLRKALEFGEAFRDQVVRVQTAEGMRWWSVTAKPLHDGDGRLRGWRGVLSDVTSERQSHRHLSFLAHFDSLTGLANRVSLRNRLAQTVEQALQPSGRRGALLCLDLDNFKAINDTLGHSVGDAVLQATAQRLRKLTRKSDLCGRLGGDEFAVVLDDVRNDQEVQQFAQRLVASLRMPIDALGMSVTSGVSIGVAHVPQHARSVDEALVAADLALYAAKTGGRGRIGLFTEELGASQRRRMDVERELREALARNQLQVHYQPQVDIERWEITGADALVRWNHPTLGQVSPVEFIEVAEKTGLIHNIGAWVLDRACADARRVLPGLRIAVNVSAAQLQREGFVEQLGALLKNHQLPATRLEVEITESLLMENVRHAIENLHAIKQLGVHVALDDFGTGYSSLAYLRQFPFDKLKIDRAFIQELMQASDARAIVRTMLELARVLGMDTLAEGVEEPAQLEVLRRVGCSSMQGYLLARPMPARDLADLIRRWPELPRPLASDELPVSVQGSLSGALGHR